MTQARPRARGTMEAVSVHHVEVMFEANGASSKATFDSTDVSLGPNIEAAITACLLPAMAQGANLVVEGPASARLLKSAETLGDIYHAWHPDALKKVTVNASAVIERKPSERARVGMFFTAGLDSFYTLLKHQEEITDLIYIHGFGAGPASARRDLKKAANVRKAGELLGKRVIEVTTDIRKFSTRFGLNWTHLAGGPAMNAVGQLLHPELRRIYIASTFAYADLCILGTTPLTDPLWSTEALEFVHDGCESARPAKAALVATSDAAMQTLRVCDAGSPNALNCGKCEKCLRTMTQLIVVGALERCTTFGAPFDHRLLARLRFKTPAQARHHENNLRAVEATGAHAEIARAIRTSLVRARRPQQLKALVQATSPALFRMLRLARRALRGGGQSRQGGGTRETEPGVPG